MISAQTSRFRREGKPLHIFPDHASAKRIWKIGHFSVKVRLHFPKRIAAALT
jgi:hypothetical protein